MEFADIRIDGIQLTVPKYPIKFLRQMPSSRHLECNFQQARDFLTEYGRDETDEDADFQSRAREILERAVQALDGIGVPFWISSGTCLGIKSCVCLFVLFCSCKNVIRQFRIVEVYI